MRSRAILLGGVLAGLTALTACGDSGGATGSPAVTRIPPTNYVTIAPATTSTTIPLAPGETTTLPPGTPLPETTYTVKGGDILVRIARAHGLTAEAIAIANGWADGVDHLIYQGMVIKIPAGGVVTATEPSTSSTVAVGSTGASGASSTSTTVRSTSTTIAGGQSNCAEGEYKLVEDDTPSGVARKFDTTVEALNAVNANTKYYSSFAVGITIKIPAKSDC